MKDYRYRVKKHTVSCNSGPSLLRLSQMEDPSPSWPITLEAFSSPETKDP